MILQFNGFLITVFFVNGRADVFSAAPDGGVVLYQNTVLNDGNAGL